MIGVIYARYSSDSQREESIEGQLRECYAFAEREGISIFDTYIDRALSAKTDNRPQFQKMIKDSSKQKFDVVIVWKLDRFARNRFDSAHYKNVLKKNKVRVISATENISEGSEGILLESVLEGMAEYYSAELAEKVGRGMTGESGTGRSGAVHRYYKCNGAKYKHTCDKKTVKKDWIENIVIKYTREMMMSNNVLEDIAGIVFRNFQKENPVIQLLKQRLSETETALNNLLKAIEEGIITSTTKQRMLELEQTRDEINLKLIKEEMKKPTITKEGLMLWLKQIQTISLETKEHKQRLIDCFVNAVYLYDDKLVNKETSKTVTLKEVNGSIIECSGAPRYGDSPKAISVSYCRRCFEILVLLSFAARQNYRF